MRGGHTERFNCTLLTQSICKLPTLAVTCHFCQADQHPATNQSCCLILFHWHTKIWLRRLHSSCCVQYPTTTHKLYLYYFDPSGPPPPPPQKKNTVKAVQYFTNTEYIPFLWKLNKQLLPSDYVEQQHANNCNLLTQLNNWMTYSKVINLGKIILTHLPV